jgi:hypothetical protein
LSWALTRAAATGEEVDGVEFDDLAFLEDDDEDVVDGLVLSALAFDLEGGTADDDDEAESTLSALFLLTPELVDDDDDEGAEDEEDEEEEDEASPFLFDEE